MEGVGQVQRWALFYLGLVWGTLAILISLAFFYCEWKPEKCEAFRRWLERNYPPRRKR
ncbi:MAG: hypothetical protein GXO08_05805 [Aquificae bacterium]|nr:hypothetical protein [Aquificota bacterium]